MLSALGAGESSKQAGITTRIKRILSQSTEEWTSRSDIYRKLRNVQSETITDALESLLADGDIEHQRIETGTKPRDEYRVRTFSFSHYSQNSPADTPMRWACPCGNSNSIVNCPNRCARCGSQAIGCRMNELSKCLFCKQPATFRCPYDGMPLCAACAREGARMARTTNRVHPSNDADQATADRMIGGCAGRSWRDNCMTVFLTICKRLSERRTEFEAERDDIAKGIKLVGTMPRRAGIPEQGSCRSLSPWRKQKEPR